MPTGTKIDWSVARADFEAGMSKAALARKHEVSVTSVTKHQKAEGWVAPLEDDLPATSGFAEAVVTEFSGETIDIGEDPAVRIAQLETELARVQAEAAAKADDYPIKVYDSVQGVIDYFGEDRLAGIALTKMNAERKAMGFIAFDLDKTDPRVQTKMKELAEEILERRSKFAGETDLRTVKMAIPDKRQPQGYRLVAIPVEPTFNDEKARPGRAMSLARAKGFKLATPYLCQRGPCWMPAAQASGRFLYDGYCTQAHADADPFIRAKKVGGVTVTRNVSLVGSGG